MTTSTSHYLRWWADRPRSAQTDKYVINCEIIFRVIIKCEVKLPHHGDPITTEIPNKNEVDDMIENICVT